MKPTNYFFFVYTFKIFLAFLQLSIILEFFLLPHWESYVFVKQKFEILVSEFSEFYRVEIWYNSEVVTPLQSWQFSCKLMTNLRIYGILNFLNNVCRSSKFCKIWAIILKMYTNIIYRSRTSPIWPKSIEVVKFFEILSFLKIFSKLSNLCKLRVIKT